MRILKIGFPINELSILYEKWCQSCSSYSFDYILTDEDILIEIAQNCQSLLPDSPFVSNELLNIIQEDNSLNAEFRSHVTSLLNNNDYYQAFSCCIVYSFFPDNQEKISRFICSSTVLCEQQLPSEKDLDACLTFCSNHLMSSFSILKIIILLLTYPIHNYFKSWMNVIVFSRMNYCAKIPQKNFTKI